MDKGKEGEGGIGEEDTNVTAFEGLRFEDAAEGVLKGEVERRMDFVGDIKAGVRDSELELDDRGMFCVHFRVRVMLV